MRAKTKRVIPTWLSYCIIFTVLLLCAFAASAVASRIARNRFQEVQAENTLSAVRAALERVDASLSESLENALLMNIYALDNSIYKDERLPKELRSYTIFTTLRNSAGVSPYIQYITLVDSSKNLLYDSMANTLAPEEYFDQDTLSLIERNRDTLTPPLDTLGVYYRKIPRVYQTRSHPGKPCWSCLTVVLSRKDGWHLLINVNLNALWHALSEMSAKGQLAPVSPRYLLLGGNGSVVSSYGDASAEEIAAAQSLGALPFDENGRAVRETGDRSYVVRVYNELYNLTYYALISESAIANATADAQASLQSAHLALFALFTAIFAVLLLFFMRPIAKLLRETLSQDKNPSSAPPLSARSSVFSVNEMLETVARRSGELIREGENARPFYLANLLSGLMTDRELSADTALFSSYLGSLEQYGVRLAADGMWQCALLSLSDETTEADTTKARSRYIAQRLDALLAGENTCAPPVSRIGFAVELNSGRLGVALRIRSEDELIQKMDGAAREIVSGLGYKASCAIGRRVDGLARLRESYETAEDALSYCPSFDEGEMIDAERLHIRRGLLEEYWQNTEDSLLRSIWSGDVEGAQKTLAAFFSFVEENRYAIYFREMADVTITLGRVVLAAAAESKSDHSADSSPGESSFYDLFRQIPVSSRPKLKDCCLRLVTDAACRFHISPEASGKTKIRHELTVGRMLAYIDENYASELSLGVLAASFGYNTTYLSTMFKEVTGIGFSQYLENRRLDEAAKLLRNTSLWVSQISTAVGYRSVTYFSTAFRKKYRMSPDKYRVAGSDASNKERTLFSHEA